MLICSAHARPIALSQDEAHQLDIKKALVRPALNDQQPWIRGDSNDSPVSISPALPAVAEGRTAAIAVLHDVGVGIPAELENSVSVVIAVLPQGS